MRTFVHVEEIALNIANVCGGYKMQCLMHMSLTDKNVFLVDMLQEFQIIFCIFLKLFHAKICFGICSYVKASELHSRYSFKNGWF